jgi:hypothetical protein
LIHKQEKLRLQEKNKHLFQREEIGILTKKMIVSILRYILQKNNNKNDKKS